MLRHIYTTSILQHIKRARNTTVRNTVRNTIRNTVRTYSDSSLFGTHAQLAELYGEHLSRIHILGRVTGSTYESTKSIVHWGSFNVKTVTPKVSVITGERVFEHMVHRVLVSSGAVESYRVFETKIEDGVRIIATGNIIYDSSSGTLALNCKRLRILSEESEMEGLDDEGELGRTTITSGDERIPTHTKIEECSVAVHLLGTVYTTPRLIGDESTNFISFKLETRTLTTLYPGSELYNKMAETGETEKIFKSIQLLHDVCVYEKDLVRKVKSRVKVGSRIALIGTLAEPVSGRSDFDTSRLQKSYRDIIPSKLIVLEDFNETFQPPKPKWVSEKTLPWEDPFIFAKKKGS